MTCFKSLIIVLLVIALLKIAPVLLTNCLDLRNITVPVKSNFSSSEIVIILLSGIGKWKTILKYLRFKLKFSFLKKVDLGPSLSVQRLSKCV